MSGVEYFLCNCICSFLYNLLTLFTIHNLVLWLYDYTLFQSKYKPFTQLPRADLYNYFILSFSIVIVIIVIRRTMEYKNLSNKT